MHIVNVTEKFHDLFHYPDDVCYFYTLKCDPECYEDFISIGNAIHNGGCISSFYGGLPGYPSGSFSIC